MRFLAITSIALILILVGCTGRCGDGICQERENSMSNCEEDCKPVTIGPAGNTSGDSINYLQIDGTERTYLLHVPSTYESTKKYPLIVMFHGGGRNVEGNDEGDGAGMIKMTGLNDISDRDGFVVAYPNGINHNWNDGRNTTDAYKAGADDITFVRALVEDVKKKVSIDPSRIYATGVSNGGVFSHRVGCEMSDVFAAIGPMISSIASNLVPSCNPSSPISVVSIQGTLDPFMPIEGGDSKHKQLGVGDGGLVESAERAMKLWASKNNCQDEPTVVNIPPKVNDGTSVKKITYSHCDNGTEVTYFIVEGMGHTVPPKRDLGRLTGPTSGNIHSVEEVLKFFQAHPKQ